MLSLVLDKVRSDIVCISEHWCCSDALRGVVIHGYTLQAAYCRDAGLHGGVAIYARDGLVYRDVNLSRFSLPFHAEFAGIECAELGCLVVAVYRSPLHGKYTTFFEQLEKMLNIMYATYKRVIILGDFNCDPDKHPGEAGALQCIMASYNLQQTIEGYTRVTRTSRSRLDNIYINFSESDYKADIYDPALSDHAGLIIILPSGHSMARRGFTYKNIVSLAGLTRLRSMLGGCNWSQFGLLELGGEKAMIVFLNFLLYCMSECGVVRCSRVRQEERSPVYWFTDELRSMRDTLQALKTVCTVTQKVSDWDTYRAYKNTYRGCIKQTKRSAYNNFISAADDRRRCCWRIINSESVSGRKQNRINVPLSADTLNSHFTRTAERILEGLPDPDYASLNDLDRVPVRSSTIFLTPVTSSELAAAILGLKNKSSLDYYDMGAEMLKCICGEVVQPLASIINMCMSEGVFPYPLKINKVVPVHKKGALDQVDNYRPIAIQPVIAKIFEKALKTRLLEFLESNRVLSPRQFGFRRGSSSVLAVLRLLEDVVGAFDEGRRTEVTLCDLTKAFDCVSTGILLDKLYSCGIRGVCHDLLRSYLTDRRQFVVVNGRKSEILSQNFGVPQGSIIGPLLFLIYINDLPDCVDGASTLLFADDTTIYTSHADVGIAAANMKRAMVQASDWFTMNRLALNQTKTQTITLATDRNVPRQNPVSLLGLVIDQRLTWASQVDRVCARASSGIYALRNLASLVTNDVLRMAYFALVHSHLSYGVLLWGGSAESRRAFVTQKKAIRVMVNRSTSEPCRDWFRLLKILTLPSLYILYSCVHVHGLASSLLTRADVHSYNTRGHDLLLIPKSRTCVSEKNKVNLKLYNALPDDFKLLTMTRFKYKLKHFFTDKAFYSVDEYLKADFANS